MKKYTPFKKFLFESPLSNVELSKIFRGTNTFRAEKFIDKYKNNEQFEMVGGNPFVVLKQEPEVTAKLDDMLAKGKFNFDKKLIFHDLEGNAYTISDFKKNAEFGSSKGSGGGAENTANMESLQCWYCAAEFHGKPIEECGYFVDTPTNLNPKMELEKGWQNTMTETAKILRQKIKGDNFKFHRDSSLVHHLMELFKIANKNSGSPFSGKDKWNPGDIWIVAPNAESEIKSFKSKTITLDELNNKMLEWYNAEKLMGVSLKKFNKEAHLEVFNHPRFPNAVTMTAIGNRNKKLSGSKDIYVELNKMHNDVSKKFQIQFRTFGDGVGAWQGEIQGKSANGGKVGSGRLDKFALDNFGTDFKFGYLKTMKKQDRVAEIIEMNKQYHINPMSGTDEQELLQKPDEWLISKVLGMRLYHLIKTHSTDKVNAFFGDIIGYAYSSTDSSSVFIKVS